MKKMFLVKEISIKSLVTGDKSGRVTLETLFPEDVAILASLSEETMIHVEFSKPKAEKKTKVSRLKE